MWLAWEHLGTIFHAAGSLGWLDVVRTTSCPLSKGTTDQYQQIHRCVVEAEWDRTGAVVQKEAWAAPTGSSHRCPGRASHPMKIMGLGVTARKHIGLAASVSCSLYIIHGAVGRLTIYMQEKPCYLQPGPGEKESDGPGWTGEDGGFGLERALQVPNIFHPLTYSEVPGKWDSMAFEASIGAAWDVFLVESVVGWGFHSQQDQRIIVDTLCRAIVVVIIVAY